MQPNNSKQPLKEQALNFDQEKQKPVAEPNPVPAPDLPKPVPDPVPAPVGNPTSAPTTKEEKNQGVTTMERTICDSVLTRVTELTKTGEIMLPHNYSVANALKAAWLILLDTEDKNHHKALTVCTTKSIANALFKMAISGLSVAKKQCFFVVYDNELSCDDSYFGKVMIAKRDAKIVEVNPVTVYEADEFEYIINKNGRKTVTKHVQKLGNIDITKIVGAYAVITYEDGSIDAEVMSMDQIRTAWNQGGSKGNSPAHRNFTDQMAEKTVINRALKIPVESTDDSTLFLGRQPQGQMQGQGEGSKHKPVLAIEDSIQMAEVVTDSKPELAPAAVLENKSNQQQPQF